MFRVALLSLIPLAGSLFAWLVVAAGCVTPATAPAPAPVEVETRAPSPPLPELPAGECGGFTGAGLGSSANLLHDRLRMATLRGMEDLARPRNIMGPSTNHDEETRLLVEGEGDAAFVVFSREVFARPGDDLLASLSPSFDEDHSLHRLDEAPLPAVVVLPDVLDTSSEGVPLLHLFTSTADALLQMTSFYATPEAVGTGGCRRLALELARSVEPGHRLLRLEAGPRTLHSQLGMTLPPDFHLGTDEGPDFELFRVHALVEFGELPAFLEIYVGGHPARIDTEGARQIPARILGNTVHWTEREEAGVLRRDLILHDPDEYGAIHLFAKAREPETLAALTDIAESLVDAPTRRPLAPCVPEASPAPIASVSTDDDLETLMDAPSFTGFDGTWARPSVAEARAFRALVGRPHAAAAFRRLAIDGRTVEARLYGLAGLRVVDPAGFEPIVCNVRSELAPTATALTSCGEVEIDVGATIESSAEDAIRGESHWRHRQWAAALRNGTADIRGGALPMQMLAPDRAGLALRAHSMSLQGEGFLPPLDGSAESSPPLVAGTRDRGAALVVDRYGHGACGVRRDGRLVCWGRARSLMGAEGDSEADAVLFPDRVRFPIDLARDHGRACLLDGAGTRVCWGGIGRSARLRADACGGPSVPEVPIILRRFDDGPWERLVAATPICGIHRDGRMHCFVGDPTRELPDWATFDRSSMSYALPIEGHVVGAERRLRGAVAWTRGGGVFLYDRGEAPRQIGRFDGLLGVAAGVGSALFAWMEDGRVMAWGLRDREEWYRHYGGPSIEQWVEIPELRGGAIVAAAYHGCALFPGGRVACFGKEDAFDEMGDRHSEVGLTEVSALRGARSLHLGQRRVCGLLAGRRLRCVGKEAADATRSAGRRGVTELNLGRVFDRAVELDR